MSFLNNKFIKKKFIFILIILGLLVSTQLFYEPFQQDPVRVNKPIPVLAQKNIKPQREGVTSYLQETFAVLLNLTRRPRAGLPC